MSSEYLPDTGSWIQVLIRKMAAVRHATSIALTWRRCTRCMYTCMQVCDVGATAHLIISVSPWHGVLTMSLAAAVSKPTRIDQSRHHPGLSILAGGASKQGSGLALPASCFLRGCLSTAVLGFGKVLRYSALRDGRLVRPDRWMRKSRCSGNSRSRIGIERAGKIALRVDEMWSNISQLCGIRWPLSLPLGVLDSWNKARVIVL